MSGWWIICILLLIQGCAPSSSEDFQNEGLAECRQLLELFQNIENQEDLVKMEPLLKKRFEKLVDLIIQARQFQLKHPEEDVCLQDINKVFNMSLIEELERLYLLEGGREIVERSQREALLRLDGFERNIAKQQEKLKLK